MNTYNEKALQAMVQSILEDGRKKATMQYHKKEEELSLEYNAKKDQILKDKELQIKQIDKEHGRRISQYEAKLLREYEVELSLDKKRYTDEMAQRVEDALHSYLSENLRAIVLDVLQSLQEAPIQLQIAEHSTKELNAEFLASLPNNVTIHEEMKKNDGGFQILCKGVIYNAFYSALVEDLMSEYAVKYMKELSAYGE